MSAVAATIPLPLLRSLPPPSPRALASSAAATTDALSPTAYALQKQPQAPRAMHPDCLLLTKRGVATSPLLSPGSAYSAKHSAKASDKMCSGSDEEDTVRIIDDDDDLEEAEENEGLADEAEEDEHMPLTRRCNSSNNNSTELDAMSLCSDDSELSVGQEESGSGAGETVRQRRLLLSGLCRPAAISSVSASVDGSDARSTASTDEAAAHGEDDSCALTPTAAGLDPFAMAHALRIPVPIAPPPRANVSPSAFQDEFLRKSQLYAEELMKQQMQLMAAARASAFSLRHVNADGCKPLIFRAESCAAAPAPPKSDAMPNFAGIHSHLSAISKMSQLSAAAAAAAAAAAVARNQQSAAAAGGDALAKLTALGMAQQHALPAQAAANNAITASSLHQLQAHVQAQLPFMRTGGNHNHSNSNSNNNDIDDNLNEPALKFSIDNILKADFGRRITDPLLKRAGGGAATSGSNGARAARLASLQRSKKPPNGQAHASTAAATASLDFAAAAAANVTTLNFSSSLANICTNSNDSSSTAVSSNCGGASDFGKSGMGAAGQFSPQLDVTASEDGKAQEAAGGANSSTTSTSSSTSSGSGPIVWPAWVYCTRYSDRPSSGPRARKPKKPASEKGASPPVAEDKRPRTAFSGSQLARLKHEFTENRYLTEKRRQQLSSELGLNEAQIKIWFQNKRAKLKKSSGTKNPLALQLMAQGLYNHSTVPLTREEEELQELQERENAAAAAACSGAVST